MAEITLESVGKVYPEFAEVSLFVEQFYEEMDYRIQKL